MDSETVSKIIFVKDSELERTLQARAPKRLRDHATQIHAHEASSVCMASFRFP